MKKNSIHNLTTGSIPLSLLSFTLPMLMTQFAQQLFNLADGLIISRAAGATALAAVGTASLFLSVLLNFFIGLSTGMSVLTANLFGAGQHYLIKKNISTSFFLCLVTGFFFSIVGFFIIPFYLTTISSPEPVYSLTATYLRICIWGLIPQLIFQIGSAILRSLGNTQTAFFQLLIVSLVNILLDILLIYVLNLGISGAASATLCAQWLLAGLMVNQLYHLPQKWALSLKKQYINFSSIPSILQIGMPSGLQAIFMSISSLILQTFINAFGTAAIAGMTTFSRLEGFLYYPAFSFGMTVTSFISQNLGAEKTDRIRKSVFFDHL